MMRAVVPLARRPVRGPAYPATPDMHMLINISCAPAQILGRIGKDLEGSARIWRDLGISKDLPGSFEIREFGAAAELGAAAVVS